MNIHNLALVRATNVIPFSGVVRPISHSYYLCKSVGEEFSSMISDLLQELKIRPPFDWSKIDDPDYQRAYQQILLSYLPYISDYNSYVLFSLNGICPDDDEHGFGNNIFSDKKCGIIEPLAPHIKQVASLVPTDTALRGDVLLSDEAILCIEEQTFLNLTDYEKEQLNHLPFTIKTFTGSLKDAIYQELEQSGRYQPEVLSLSRKDGGFRPSFTSEEQKENIHTIAKEYGISKTLFFNLLTQDSEELNKAWIVRDYYTKSFLEQLLEIMGAADTMKSELSYRLHDKSYMARLKTLIKEFGISRYQQFVLSYNRNLKRQQEDKTLLTPDEVVKKVQNEKENKYGENLRSNR